MGKINGNTYKLDILGEYQVSSTFNVFNLSPFNAGANVRTNTFEERDDKEQQMDPTHGLEEEVQYDEIKLNEPNEELNIPIEPITRA